MARILIIDDEEPFRQMLREVLELAGYEVEEAKDGLEGLYKCRTGKFDVAIVDLFMPEKEGIEVIREFVRDFPNIKIIAVTGGGFTGKHNFLPMADEFGAHKSLQKPFGTREMLDAVEELLGEE